MSEEVAAYYQLNNQVKDLKDGFYDLEKDKEAIVAFQEEVNKKTMRFSSVVARYEFLIVNGYYYQKVLDQYSLGFIEELTAKVDSYHFKFQSFMAIEKFYHSYALKTNDKEHYLEDYKDHVVIVALYLGQGDRELAEHLAISMIEQRYQPATPTFMNAGRAKGGELVSCYLLSVADSLNSIYFNVTTGAQLSKIGGGVAFNLSYIRGSKDPIQDVKEAAQGVIPVMKVLEDTFKYVDQLGQRPGAGAAYLNIFHWDVVDFLESKRISVDEAKRIQTLSLGLIIPDKFYDLTKRNMPFYVFSPYDVEHKYHKPLAELDMNRYYDILVQDNAIRKQSPMSARDFMNQIMRTLLESGYPYVMNIDNANKLHALRNIGTVKMSNLC